MKTAPIGFIIQARFGSTRLAGKVLIPFYGKQTILEIIINRLHTNYPAHTIVLATSVSPSDDVIADAYKNDTRVKLFRGDESNVIKRFIDAAQAHHLDHVIRICSDNPFLLASPYTEMMQKYLEAGADYLSYRFKNNTPVIKSHLGLYGEITSVAALKKVMNLTTDSLYYEHVTNYLYAHPEIFKLAFLPVPDELEKYFSKLRLTIDTQEDFKQLQKLYNTLITKFGEGYTLKNILTEVESDVHLQGNMQKQIENNAK